MKRLVVCWLIAVLAVVSTRSAGAVSSLNTVVDYTFDDASVLNQFFLTGTPEVIDGQLVLDGSSYIEIDDPLNGATENYVIEAIVTADSFDSFDFVFARNDILGAFGGNNGQGLLIQDLSFGVGQINALNSNSGFISTAQLLVPGEPTAVAIVQAGTLTQVYINGVRDAATSPPIIGTPNNFGIGTHPFDGEVGAFNGSIDRVRVSTFAPGEFNEADLLPVPEPTSLALLGLGGLALARRRR